MDLKAILIPLFPAILPAIIPFIFENRRRKQRIEFNTDSALEMIEKHRDAAVRITSRLVKEKVPDGERKILIKDATSHWIIASTLAKDLTTLYSPASKRQAIYFTICISSISIILALLFFPGILKAIEMAYDNRKTETMIVLILGILTITYLFISISSTRYFSSTRKARRYMVDYIGLNSLKSGLNHKGEYGPLGRWDRLAMMHSLEIKNELWHLFKRNAITLAVTGWAFSLLAKLSIIGYLAYANVVQICQLLPGDIATPLCN